MTRDDKAYKNDFDRFRKMIQDTKWIVGTVHGFRVKRLGYRRRHCKSNNSSVTEKRRCKQLLFLALAFMLLNLVDSRTLCLGDDRKQGKAERNIYFSNNKGDRKMGTADWLSEDEGESLLAVARNAIKNRLNNVEPPQIDWKDLPERFQEQLGTFVTVTIDGNLRGCIGHIIPRETVIEGIRENALNAAFRDPRFPPLTREEFDKIEIEISILTAPQELSYTDADDLLSKLRPGVDGVIIKKGYHEATFLPQVWEQLPDKEEFLSHLCLKAGLPHDGWCKERLQVSTYQVQAFEEKRAK
jgi:AmmeMemoRadiSam system protein A